MRQPPGRKRLPGVAGANLHSLIASAKQHRLDPFAYLRDLLARIPSPPHRAIAQLFPNHSKIPTAQP